MSDINLTETSDAKSASELESILELTHRLSWHQRLETMGVIASSVNHDVNNLLTPIMGYTILAMENLPPGNDEIEGYLEKIYEAGEKAKELTSRLVKQTRKPIEEKFTDFAPEDIVVQAIELVEPVRPSNVKLVKDFRCHELCIKASKTQITQVVMNIIINAYQALAESGGIVTIITMRSVDDVRITISDDGPGISEQDLAHITEPFYTTKSSEKGSGLGLAIVEQILSVISGRLEIESEPGVGSSFTIVIPAHQCQG